MITYEELIAEARMNPNFAKRLALGKKMQGKAQPTIDANKDAKKYAAEKPSKPAKTSNKIDNTDLAKISRIVVDAISNSFPDGDPVDTFIRKIKREFSTKVYDLYDHQIMDLVDKALKKTEKVDYDKYMKRFWQGAVSDMSDSQKKDLFGTTNPRNPW